ncbi:hypothetical protein ES703_62258 [subsurface metagenome]
MVQHAVAINAVEAGIRKRQTGSGSLDHFYGQPRFYRQVPGERDGIIGHIGCRDDSSMPGELYGVHAGAAAYLQHLLTGPVFKSEGLMHVVLQTVSEIPLLIIAPLFVREAHGSTFLPVVFDLPLACFIFHIIPPG